MYKIPNYNECVTLKSVYIIKLYVKITNEISKYIKLLKNGKKKQKFVPLNIADNRAISNIIHINIRIHFKFLKI